MNPSDRSIRAGWQQFSLYSVLIMVFVGLFTNLATLALIAFAVETLYIPLTVIIILVNLLVAAGTVDGISDWDAIRHDYDEEEKENAFSRTFCSNKYNLF